jgi:hypothetical protein
MILQSFESPVIMPQYTESQLQSAIAEVEGGEISCRSAAERYGIPRTTLTRRLKGAQTRTLAQEARLKLDASTEDVLARWILQLDSEGRAPSHTLVKKMAGQLGHTSLGQRWITRFLKRHPNLKTQRTYRVHQNRLNGATPDAINGFFDTYEKLVTQRAILPSNIWNFDETGIAQGLGINGMVVGSSGKRRTYSKDTGAREWSTILHAISATGGRTTPTVIFNWVNGEIALH